MSIQKPIDPSLLTGRRKSSKSRAFSEAVVAAYVAQFRSDTKNVISLDAVRACVSEEDDK